MRGRFQQGDDDIVLEALVEMTDHETTDDGSKHPVTIKVKEGLTVGNKIPNLTKIRNRENQRTDG